MAAPDTERVSGQFLMCYRFLYEVLLTVAVVVAVAVVRYCATVYLAAAFN
jgi:hypothetical protein